MARKNDRISIDVDAPEITEPSLQVRDDFVSPFIARTQSVADNEFFKLGEGLKDLSGSLADFGKAMKEDRERESEELSIAMESEYREATEEEKVDLIKRWEEDPNNRGITPKNIQYVMENHGDQIAHKVSKELWERIEEASNPNARTDTAAFAKQIATEHLEDLPESVRDNPWFTQSFWKVYDNKSRNWEYSAGAQLAKRRTKQGQALMERSVENNILGVLDGETGVVKDPVTGDVLMSLDTTVQEQFDSTLQTVFSDYNEKHKGQLDPHEQTEIFEKAVTQVVDTLSKRSDLENLEELGELIENVNVLGIGQTDSSGRDIRPAMTALIEAKIEDVEERRKRLDGTNTEAKLEDDAYAESKSTYYAVLRETRGGAKRLTYQEFAARIAKDLGQEELDQYGIAAADRLWNDYLDKLATLDSRDKTEDRYDRSERLSEERRKAASLEVRVLKGGLTVAQALTQLDTYEMDPNDYELYKLSIEKAGKSTQRYKDGDALAQDIIEDSEVIEELWRLAQDTHTYGLQKDALEFGEDGTNKDEHDRTRRNSIRQIERRADRVKEEALEEFFAPVESTDEDGKITYTLRDPEEFGDFLKDKLNKSFQRELEKEREEADRREALGTLDPTPGETISGVPGVTEEVELYGFMRGDKRKQTMNLTQSLDDANKVVSSEAATSTQKKAAYKDARGALSKYRASNQGAMKAYGGEALVIGSSKTDAKMSSESGANVLYAEAVGVNADGRLVTFDFYYGLSSDRRTYIPFRELGDERFQSRYSELAGARNLKGPSERDTERMQLLIQTARAMSPTERELKNGTIYFGDSPLKLTDAEKNAVFDPKYSVLLPEGVTESDIKASKELWEEDVDKWEQTPIGQAHAAYVRILKPRNENKVNGAQFLALQAQLGIDIGIYE